MVYLSVYKAYIVCILTRVLWSTSKLN